MQAQPKRAQSMKFCKNPEIENNKEHDSLNVWISI